MPADKIETLHGSVVQHGHHNDRIYLMHLHGADSESLIQTLDKMAADRGYGKIFAKIPAPCWQPFLAAGYVREATVPGFFKGTTDGLFVAKFLSEERRKSSVQIHQNPVETIPARDRIKGHTVAVDRCSSADAEKMAAMFREVFSSYAFPIHRPAYIRRMMEKNVAYFCVRVKGKIAALSAAEIDEDSQSCEMTDFATRPDYRSKGFAGILLDRMQEAACERGIKTFYTIARADSYGMNRVFSNKGYRHAGRLVKNTQIGGRIRSMNVWYKNSGKS